MTIGRAATNWFAAFVFVVGLGGISANWAKATSKALFGALLALALLVPPAAAEPTRVTVRVISKGAKFVGTSMGGVRIVIRDADSGALLASGVTRGGTGDTKRIMVAERKPGGVLSTKGAARFVASIDIDEPRRIEVVALGPLAQRQSANRVSATQWVVPGRHITGGDGFLLVLPGFVVDVLAPPAHVKLKGTPRRITLRANVTMMCGCPIKPGGIWDADRYEVKALIRRNGTPVGSVALSYAGSTSQFSGDVTVDAPGTYEAVVYAYDPTNGNTGLDRTTFVVAQ